MLADGFVDKPFKSASGGGPQTFYWGAVIAVKAAQRASRAATGDYFATADKAAAGQWAHYLFGAGLGGAYGLLAEYRPEVTAGFGTAFGLGSGLLFDEIAVPAAGLSGPPDDYPAMSHVYSAASHLVFGSVSEGVRRVLRSA